MSTIEMLSSASVLESGAVPATDWAVSALRSATSNASGGAEPSVPNCAPVSVKRKPTIFRAGAL